MSKFQKDQENRLEIQLEKMIKVFTGFVPGQKNYDIAQKYASSNLKYHRFADTDAMTVKSKFEGILVKLQVMCKPETADFLGELFQALQKQPLTKEYLDVPHRILNLLMLLSQNIIEVNQHREPNRSILKGKKVETLSISSIDSLNQWEFESSSSEEAEDENVQQKENDYIEEKNRPSSPEQQLPNILWHTSCNQKRTFTEFLNSSQQSITSNQIFMPEYQNSCQQINNHNIVLLIAAEKDLVAAILYSLQGLTSELLIYHDGQYQLGDINIAHMSHESLRQTVKGYLELANILQHLRKTTYLEKPSLYQIEALVQEQFWIAVGELIMEFEGVIGQFLEEMVFHGKEYESNYHEPITLMQLGVKLQKWMKCFKQINEIAKLEECKQESLFSSPTLSKLYKTCIQNQLQTDQEQICGIFLCCVDPYLKLIDKYLDYNSQMQDDFNNVPAFLEPCIQEMKNIGLAYQIFMKVQVPALKQIKFRENFILRLCESQTIIQKQMNILSLKGQFQYEQPFSIENMKSIIPLEQQEEESIKMKQYYSLKRMKNALIIQTFSKELCHQIRKEDQEIQNILLKYLNKDFLKIHKYLRCLFLFERSDLVEYMFDRLEYTQGGLRTLQNQLQDNLKDIYDLQPKLENPLQIKVNLPHPIDLIINQNSLSLFNKIFQFLQYFKNSKQNLLTIQLQLKKKGILRQFLDFLNQLMNFMQNYEYFLFISVIQNQSEIFLKNYQNCKQFSEIVDHHTNYLKIISDKMLLNQKSESILQAIRKIIEIVQNYPTICERAIGCQLLDSITKKLESDRIQSEFIKIKQSFEQQILALILLFDTNIQRFSHAPEIIECMMKVNFNYFYKI